jgi:hypothetical protein
MSACFSFSIAQGTADERQRRAAADRDRADPDRTGCS